VPLRYGAGIKGKVIEGMHFGIPIVTTSVGAEGIEDAKSCFQVADSADEFADAILKLYDDEDRLYDMAVNSIEYVNHTYSETTALKVIDQIMEEENVQ
jgi:glycosyltransferase involved in cell wall biosynthesis